MSGFQTHMLIGAVGGLALIRVADHLAPGALPVVLPGQPRLITEAVIIAVSAVAATLPDIDEPGSWLSRRVHAVITLLGAGFGATLGLHLGERALNAIEISWSAAFALCLIVGTIVGSGLGWLLLRLIRAGAGGHRAGTHSIWFGGGLLLAAAALHLAGITHVALGALTLAWGWALHIPGDIVTPAGWRPLAPFSTVALRLPRPMARYGETMIATAAVLVGLLLIQAR